MDEKDKSGLSMATLEAENSTLLMRAKRAEEELKTRSEHFDAIEADMKKINEQYK